MTGRRAQIELAMTIVRTAASIVSAGLAAYIYFHLH
jgi:hypothetical protein